ncbi:MAG TPA: DUF58 domain-containing protein [Clostridiaceae bacterium]|nr:DUF58 domain-containing protein [Clostridiaceae bacterium]
MDVIALLVIFFAGILLQSFLFSRYAFYKLDYKCEFSMKEAHVGDELFLVETVHNRKFLPVPWLKADIHSSRWLDYAGTKSVIAQENRRVTSNFYLKGYQRVTRYWKLTCLKRGVFTIDEVTLISGDLLGYSGVSVPVTVGATIAVYPDMIDLEKMFINTNYLQGDTIVKRWIVDDPFITAGTREYTPHDPMNRIHWPATAKQGRLMVRKNDFTSRLKMSIILNIQSIEYEYDNVVYKERIEIGIRVAATLLDRALRMGMPVRFATNGCTVDERQKVIFTNEASGKEHVGEIMKMLAKLELRNVKDFELFMADIMGHMENNEVILITSYINDGICEIARSISRHSNIVKLFILDKFVDLGKLPGDIETYIFSGNIKIT